MYVVAVSVVVKAEFIGQFIDATKLNASASRTEAGNVRWDFSQAEDDPSRFLLYEVYTSKDAFLAHQQTAHYLQWKAAVADWMAQPRSGVKYHSLIYGDSPVRATYIEVAVAAAPSSRAVLREGSPRTSAAWNPEFPRGVRLGMTGSGRDAPSRQRRAGGADYAGDPRRRDEPAARDYRLQRAGRPQRLHLQRRGPDYGP